MAAVEKDFGVWGIFSVREAAEIFFEVVSFCLVILGRGKLGFGHERFLEIERGSCREEGEIF